MAQENPQCDEAGEPKHAGDGIQGQNSLFMGEAWEVDGAKGKVDGHEEGPEGDEDEEIHLVGGVGGGTGVVPGCDCEALVE